MGSRYVVSGVQLGMLQAYLDTNQKEEGDKLLKNIILNQCIGISSKSVEEDASKIILPE